MDASIMPMRAVFLPGVPLVRTTVLRGREVGQGNKDLDLKELHISNNQPIIMPVAIIMIMRPVMEYRPLFPISYCNDRTIPVEINLRLTG